MGFVAGEERGQWSLLPARLDDYVGAGSLTRVIDAFVGQLEMRGLGFARWVAAETGRPPYDPRDLLKLYVWGYVNEVRSSRKLERECGRNVEAMWLTGKLVPDHKTIADFRRDNGAGIVAASRALVEFCRAQGLLGRVVAIDGSKFRAAASVRDVIGAKKIAKAQARIDAKIAGYLAALDAADAAEAEQEQVMADAARVAAALAALDAQKAALAAQSAALAASGRKALVEGEPEARVVKLAGRLVPVYNVQTATDAASGMIVHHEVITDAGDNRQLEPMAKAAQEALGGGPLKVIADAGYSNGAQAAACEAAGIEPCAPANRSANPQGDFFARAAFRYEAADDVYVCPAGQRMRRVGRSDRDHLFLYRTNACRTCPLKAQCTKGKRRTVTRHYHEDALARMNARVEADPGLMRLRGCVAEPPYGTIKRKMGNGRFLLRGLAKVTGEIALSILAFNLHRIVNLAAARNRPLAWAS
jgi:transposase/IS5 family transposase